MSDAELPGPPAGPQAASPLLVAGVCLLGIAFGAVSGLHVLGLMSGHAQFLVTKEIERFVAGQSMWSAPVPTARLPLWELSRQMPLLGGAPWLQALTYGLALVCAGGILLLINPRLWRRLRAGDIAWWRPVVALVATAGVLVGALWELPDAVLHTTFPFTRAALAGGLAWLLWHRRGWLHTVERPPSLWVILGQLVCGALVGLTAHAFMRHELTSGDLAMLNDWLSAGYYDEGMWRQLALYSIGLHAWGGLLAAIVACFLGQPGTSLRARLRSILPGLLLLALSAGAGRVYTDRVWYDAYEFRESTAAVLSLDGEYRPERRLVLLIDQEDQPVPFRVAMGESWLPLPTTEPVAALARHNLLVHGGRSCTAKLLWFHLHETATWNWDSLEALKISREQTLAPSSTPIFGAMILEALQRLPNDPEVRKVLDELLAGQSWSFPSPESRRELLTAAWRFRRLDDVVARMGPEQQGLVQELRQKTPPRSDNKVTGRLLLAGQPLADVRVGLVREEDWDIFFRDPRIPLAAWDQRLVVTAATTAADGSYAFNNLFDGAYRLVIRLGPRLLPGEGGLIAQGFGGRITLKGGQARALPLLNLMRWEQPAQAEEVDAPGTPPVSRAL